MVLLQTRNPPITRQHLAALFASEAVMGIRYEDPYSDGSEVAMLPDDFGDMGRCTNCAHYVVHRVGRGDVFGFLTEDNPRVTHRAVLFPGGHDFALIDRRFIVDPWVSHYTGEVSQTVFDLHDPGDRPLILALYGNPACWRRYNPERERFDTDPDPTATSDLQKAIASPRQANRHSSTTSLSP